jgi:hypothetical protein
MEIYGLVMQNSTQHDLARLALASSALCSIAEPLLYSRICVGSPSKKMGALETIANSPMKAGYVKFLAFQSARDQVAAHAAIAVLLASALSNTTLLVDLRLPPFKSVDAACKRLCRSLL